MLRCAQSQPNAAPPAGKPQTRYTTAMSTVEDLLCRIVTETGIPSASLVVRSEGQEVLALTRGLARRSPERPAAPDQAYDLASVTKLVAGTTVAASLVADGSLPLDRPVVELLTDPTGLDLRITPRHLLQHTSGLPAWAPLYEQVTGGWGTEEARRAVITGARMPVLHDPGAVACYSDLGFLVLLEVLEAVGGAPFDVLFQQRVLGPLRLTDLRFGWPGAAATEDCPVRGFVVEGTVHDLNCASMGGISTHAGLFGTARAVAAVGQAILDAIREDGSPLPGSALRTFAAAQGPGSHRLGFDGISAGYTSTGAFFPPDTLGHLGYTGTSVWMTPSRNTVVVLLTNRVHPLDDKETIRAVRPQVHDAVARFLGWQ